MPEPNCSGDGSRHATESRQRGVGGGRGRNLPSALFTAVFVAAATGVCRAQQQCRQATLTVTSITAPDDGWGCGLLPLPDWDLYTVSPSAQSRSCNPRVLRCALKCALKCVRPIPPV